MKTNNEVKRQAMNAITNVETVARVGMVKLTGGVSLYVARIREADRQAGTAPRKVRRDAMGREL
ncbi:MAG: hypothetical protein HY053_07085 [Proteobacteria bacterium]|nr:hypothetical protein [Pseudomonadota bacterium]